MWCENSMIKCERAQTVDPIKHGLNYTCGEVCNFVEIFKQLAHTYVILFKCSLIRRRIDVVTPIWKDVN